MLVSEIRFFGDRDEIRIHFEELYAIAEHHKNDPTVIIYHGGDSKNGYDIEVCKEGILRVPTLVETLETVLHGGES